MTTSPTYLRKVPHLGAPSRHSRAQISITFAYISRPRCRSSKDPRNDAPRTFMGSTKGYGALASPRSSETPPCLVLRHEWCASDAERVVGPDRQRMMPSAAREPLAARRVMGARPRRWPGPQRKRRGEGRPVRARAGARLMRSPVTHCLLMLWPSGLRAVNSIFMVWLIISSFMVIPPPVPCSTACTPSRTHTERRKSEVLTRRVFRVMRRRSPPTSSWSCGVRLVSPLRLCHCPASPFRFK